MPSATERNPGTLSEMMRKPFFKTVFL